MSEQMKQAIFSSLRSILIAVGSLLTTMGWVDDQTVQSVVGVVMVALPLIWGVYDKFAAERRTQAREAIAVQDTVASFTEGERS